MDLAPYYDQVEEEFREFLPMCHSGKGHHTALAAFLAGEDLMLLRLVGHTGVDCYALALGSVSVLRFVLAPVEGPPEAKILLLVLGRENVFEVVASVDFSSRSMLSMAEMAEAPSPVAHILH